MAASTVAGSWWSRRVASSMRVRCSRTRVTSTSTSRGAKPHRVTTPRVSSAPVTEWSWAPRTLPMSCSRAATSSRSGRETRRTRPAASTTVSTRWRSTVCRCTALRCGRERTAAHSGSQVSTMPTWSRPSHTVTSPGPEASRSPNRSRSGAGQGFDGVGACLARLSSVVGAIGSPARAATTPARIGIPSSVSARRVEPSTTSPSLANRPWPSGVICGRRGPTRRVRARCDWPARRSVPSSA